MMIPQRGGLPHSDIHGSKPARGSPWLFAACHVLHRLLVPRHPPNALIALHARQPHPHRPGCLSTMHRNHRRTSDASLRSSNRRHNASQSGMPLHGNQSSTQLYTNAPEHCRTIRWDDPWPKPLQATTTIPSGQTNHPMTQRTNPTAIQTSANRTSRTTTELSYAPRDAPEPDSQHKRTNPPGLAQRRARRQHGMPGHPTLSGANTDKPIEEPSHESCACSRQTIAACPSDRIAND